MIANLIAKTDIVLGLFHIPLKEKGGRPFFWGGGGEVSVEDYLCMQCIIYLLEVRPVVDPSGRDKNRTGWYSTTVKSIIVN